MAQRLGYAAVLVILIWGLPAHAWQVYRSHPFVEATADQLPAKLTRVARHVTISALQNDWEHRAVAIKVDGPDEKATVTVSLHGPSELTDHLRVRVVGFIKQKDIGYSLDPIFDNPGAHDLKLSKYMRNFENIHQFPTVTVTEQDPVFIWITADTRQLAAGCYAGGLRFTDTHGHRIELPLTLLVRPYQLPVENPLYTWGWQYGHDWVDDYHEYGINVVHSMKDMEAARAVGYKFFAITFSPAWKGKDPSEWDEAELDEHIGRARALVSRLKLRPHEWALYMKDEPTDKTVPNQARWAEHIRRKWPEARFLFNPGWGPGGSRRNEWGSIEGTIQPLLPYADVWLPYSHWLWDDRAPRSLELMKQHGHTVWFYEIMGSSYARKPTVGRGLHRRLAWIAWKYRLQGACWYSLNAYVKNMWGDCSEKEEYACTYGTVPGRGLEAVRQGIQEYKRLHEMRRLGVPGEETDRFCERLFAAQSVAELDLIRRDMDRRLLAAASE